MEVEFAVSGIGTRTPTEEQRRRCFKLGAWVVFSGGTLHSGNANGIDYAFASGGNSIDPTQVHLHLPWDSVKGFNREQIVEGNIVHVPPYPDWMEELTLRLHPRGPYLKRGALMLHTRNVSIVHPTQLCLAYPSDKIGGGGTGQGMRVAENQGIELIDLNHYGVGELRLLCERIRRKLR